MNAETIAKALGGHRAGTTWMARCPAHDDRNPSLSISAGKQGGVPVHCHTGCSQRDVIAALVNRGLWDERVDSPSRLLHARGNHVVNDREPFAKARTESAFAIWCKSQTADETLVQTYLRSRGLVVPVPPSLRFHSGLKHPSGAIWPALVAQVTDGVSGEPLAIHRTFFNRDGVGKAPTTPAKMMLGPCRGGVVRLCEPGQMLMVAEGLETSLAAMQATGKPAWAALSASGKRSLGLPVGVRELIVIVDGDEPGEAAAQCCARIWKREGRRVRIARPPIGMDFNDLLLKTDHCVVEFLP